MAYYITSPVAGFQPIANTETTQMHPLGTIVTANDPTYGQGEFIYLKGVGSTVVGSVVTFDSATFLTALAPATINTGAPVAFAMSANVANQYGWYQIAGNVIANKFTNQTLAIRVPVGVQTAGIINASATGLNVDGAVVAVAATTSAATVQLMVNRPHMQGRGS